MKQESSSIYETNVWQQFLFLCLATLFLLLIKKWFVEYETTAFEVLNERGEMGAFKAVSALQYITIPIIYLWKFVIIAFLLWVGAFMFGIKITFTKVWSVVVISEFIFLIPEILKILWFVFVDDNANFFEIRAFYPLSLISTTDTTNLDDKYFYPFKALNLFEVGYWFLLIHGIYSFNKKHLTTAIAIVFSSYVLFFFLWLGFYTMIYK